MRSTILSCWGLSTLLVSALHTRRDDPTPAADPRFLRQKIMYDTNNLPAASAHHAHSHNPLDNLKKIDPPCSDCIITFMEAHLEYTNGSVADFSTGVNLHHIVMLNMAVRDPLCGEWRERFFWAGNERTPFDFVNDYSSGKPDFGYYLNSPEEGLIFVGDFMNLLDEPQEVVFGMTWEWTQDPTLLKTMRRLSPYWLDIAEGCGDSQVPNKNNTQFAYDRTSQIDRSGQVVLAYGHAHEGAETLEVTKGGVKVCDFHFSHTTKQSPRGEGHVEPLPACVNATRVETGDELNLRVTYDTATHPIRFKDAGGFDPAMGLAMLYVIREKEDGHGHDPSLDQPAPGVQVPAISPSKEPVEEPVEEIIIDVAAPPPAPKVEVRSQNGLLYLAIGISVMANIACFGYYFWNRKQKAKRASGSETEKLDDGEENSHLLKDVQ